MSAPNRFSLSIGEDTFLVERAGSGPTVLVINGSGGTLESLQPFLLKVQKFADTISFDNRGMGGSSVPKGPWEMADYARDVKVVLDELGITSCIVLGISFGGMIAQEFAVTYPQYVEKLVLWCTSAGGSAGSSYPLHELAKLSPEELAVLAPQLVDKRFTLEWLAEHPGDRNLLPPPPTPTKQLMEVTGLQQAARSRHDVSERLGVLTMPVLLGAGNFDLMAPVENSEAIAQRVTSALVQRYEGGHLFFFQDPQAFRDLASFVTDQS
jgi:3-oxoadipate enol-lactonase